MSDDKAPTPGLRRNESRVAPDDSGAHTPSSGDGRGFMAAASPAALRRLPSSGLHRKEGTRHILSQSSDWGAEDIYPIHDGLGPDELDIEVELEDEWSDGWTTWDRVVISISCACTVIALAGLIFGWWW